MELWSLTPKWAIFGPFAFHALSEMAKKGHSTTFLNLISRTYVLFKPIFTQRKSKMILECLGPPFTKSLKSAIFANFFSKPKYFHSPFSAWIPTRVITESIQTNFNITIRLAFPNFSASRNWAKKSADFGNVSSVPFFQTVLNPPPLIDVLKSNYFPAHCMAFISWGLLPDSVCGNSKNMNETFF